MSFRTGGLPTIMPRFDKESGDAIQQAVQSVEKRGPDKAKTYLREASQFINEKGYPDSVSGRASLPSNRLRERLLQEQRRSFFCLKRIETPLAH